MLLKVPDITSNHGSMIGPFLIPYFTELDNQGTDSFFYTNELSKTGPHMGFCSTWIKLNKLDAQSFRWCLSEELLVVEQFGAAGRAIFNEFSPLVIEPPVEFKASTLAEADAQMFALLDKQFLKHGKVRIAMIFPGFASSFFGDVARATAFSFLLQKLGYVVMVNALPSRGAVALNYALDSEWYEAATESSKQFLLKLANRYGSENIVIVAHSMGNEVVSRIMRELALEGHSHTFKLICLVAADVNYDTFMAMFARAVTSSGPTVNWYSDWDKLLQISEHLRMTLPEDILEFVHSVLPPILAGNVHVDSRPRVGEGGKIPPIPGMSRVNYTREDKQDGGELGHSMPWYDMSLFIEAIEEGGRDGLLHVPYHNMADQGNGSLLYTPTADWTSKFFVTG